MVGIEQSEHDRLVLDIAVHVGTLAAICLYAWREVGQMIGGVAQLAVGRWTPGARLAALLVVVTLPLIVPGCFFAEAVSTILRDLPVLACATIILGLVLSVSSPRPPTFRPI